jgi:RNA-directed DNA polymerase
VATEPDDQERVSDTSPRRKKVIEILRKVRHTLRNSRHLTVQDAVARVNLIVRGWANYFRVGNSSRELDTVRTGVERKVRRFAVKKLKRRGLGWTRWSSAIVYGSWGLYNDYRVRYRTRAKAAPVETDT